MLTHNTSACLPSEESAGDAVSGVGKLIKSTDDRRRNLSCKGEIGEVMNGLVMNGLVTWAVVGLHSPHVRGVGSTDGRF